MNNFKKEQKLINQFINEQFAGTLAREVLPGIAKEVVKDVAPSIGREVVAGTAADALRAATSAPSVPSKHTTEIPPELEPIFRPTSKPEDKPGSKKPEKPEEAIKPEEPSGIEAYGLPILGQLLKLKFGFNPFPQPQPQSQQPSKTGTQTKTGIQDEDKGEDLSAPSLLAVPKGSQVKQYGYSSTKFDQGENPVFQREIHAQEGDYSPRAKRAYQTEDQDLKYKIRQKASLNLIESQKPTSEKPVKIPEKDTSNTIGMPKPKDILLGDPSPTQIAANMRDRLIRKRSAETKEKYSSKVNQNPPITGINAASIHHPQIDGPINPKQA